ncbi:MAG TPA: phosphatase PAP2 family protein [Chitinophagaceae bacterium]|nr:phosphatase PAP2 family protein [Chitinophagaceae bacterium]
MQYAIGEGRELVYPKPRPFGVITNIPRDMGHTAKATFSRPALVPLAVITSSTAGLMLFDQSITDGVQGFLQRNGIKAHDLYRNVISVKMGKQQVNILRSPRNINTALYETGQGFPGLVIGAGLFTYGKITHDYRSLSTASQLAESFILMGVLTQALKRITGRQSPSMATQPGGKWQWFPSFHNYQNNTSNYDAFPSGHMATYVSTLTVLIENYPEKKYIRYIGYPLGGLIGLAMINNGAHWASDYPLAVGLGYLCAHEVAKFNRRLENKVAKGGRKADLNCFVSCVNGRLLPGVLYRF